MSSTTKKTTPSTEKTTQASPSPKTPKKANPTPSKTVPSTKADATQPTKADATQPTKADATQPTKADASSSSEVAAPKDASSSLASIDLSKNPPADKDTRAAFQQHLAQIEAFPEAQVVAPTISVVDSVTLALQLHQQAQKDIARLRRLIASGELAEVSVIELRTRALALWHAQARWQHARKTKRPKSEQVHFPEALELRKEFLDAADYLWRRDARVKKILKEIREGTSQRDLADDLQQLAQLFLEHLDLIDGRTDITRDDIDRAITLSIQIMDTLLEQDQKEAIRLRNRAYSLLADAYLDVFMAGRFIHRRDKDTSALYPSLHLSPSSPSPKSEPQPNPPQDIPQPA
ncbi:hypothetical protein L6R29_14215 [Myxococcota bacterium]|nr:hypothetical protein [Myxococcota bacterium]